MQEPPQRQRAVWQQLNDTYSSPEAGWDASHLTSLRQTMQQVDGALAAAADDRESQGALTVVKR